ncbi:MAG: UPF0182 family protein [Actinomycetota bacterium]
MVARLKPRGWGRPLRLVLLALAALLLLSVSTLVRLYTDLLWYRELRFDSVFWTILGTKLLVGLSFGVIFFVFCLANLAIVSRLMPTFRLASEPQDPLQRYQAAFLPYLRWFALGTSAFLALLFGLGSAPIWERFVQAANAVSFEMADPVFARDLGFYVFRLPLYRFVYGWAFSALVVVTLVAAAAHYLTGGIRPQASTEQVTPQVKAHLSVLIGLIALLRAWGYRLAQFDLLYSTRGNVTGASYTDVHAELPALKVLVVISIIGAVLFLVNIRVKGWALPVLGVGLWLLTSVLVAGLYPVVIQRFVVAPAQLQRERPFIQRNIEATRTAYGVGGIEVREYPGTGSISREALENNPGTVDNIRLWNPKTLKTAYQTLQEIRPYYQFQDVDVDRYTIDGRLRQVMLSLREMDTVNLVETQNWQNMHLFYTHGYGSVVSPTNQADPEGEPVFFVQDIPPSSKTSVLELSQPGIYFGEALPGVYSLVRTKQKELDFGRQDGNLFTRYMGKGGVGASWIVRRLAFAWRFRNINLVVSGLIEPDSKILYYRQIQERLGKAAPFLRFDTDPYPVIAEGRVVWVADAYTVSSMYPYSERINFGARTTRQDLVGIDGVHNYVRNSVKATVDAYDGTVTFYVWDATDPIVRSWQHAFPKLFRPASAMPQAIREHVRYPEDLFRVQTSVYQRYHMTDPTDFFTNEDAWVIPPDPNVTDAVAAVEQSQETQPYYVLMRLPGAEKEEYVLILPMNPMGKRNMTSWIAAKSGPEDYGALFDFRFPKGTQVDGVGQVHARINAFREFSQARTLLGREGSTVVFGDLLVTPIDESVLYVQPIFVQGETNAIPELTFVILAASDRIVLGGTLDEALSRLVGGEGAGSPGVPQLPSDPSRKTSGEALRHLEAAEEALRRGDFATFGQELRALKEALQRTANEERLSPSPSPSGPR